MIVGGEFLFRIIELLSLKQDPAILLLRTYALYRCDKRVLAIMLAISSCLVAVGGVSSFIAWDFPNSIQTQYITSGLSLITKPKLTSIKATDAGGDYPNHCMYPCWGTLLRVFAVTDGSLRFSETSRQTAPLLVTSLMQYFTFRIRCGMDLPVSF